MKNIIIIMKKELMRFFTDKRMIMMLILPGILIFAMYNLMGTFMSDSFMAKTDYTYVVYTENEPDNYKSFNITDDYVISVYQTSEEMTSEIIKEKIQNKEIDLFIQYEENFSTKITNGEKPSVSLFYNSVSNESSEIYAYYSSCLSTGAYELTYNYYINNDTSLTYDLATKEDSSAKLITMMLPFLLMIFLYSGCMAISSEAIAGEKERGTIATLLVTPAKRSHIAIGKVLALSITSLVSSVFSFIGLIASLPKLFSGMDVSMDIYNVSSYLVIFGIIVFTVIVFTVILSVVSTLAKSVKEASQLALPVMILVMAVGITSFIGSGAATETWQYIIPIYNSVNCLTAVFALEINIGNILITFVSNTVFIALGIYLLTKMFNSEKIMFNK